VTESVRVRRAPLIGLALTAAVATATACILLRVSSDWRITADAFFGDNANVEPTQEDYEAIDRLSINAYHLTLLAGPLFVGAVVAVLALLAVLAWRWERGPIFEVPD